MNKKQLIEKNIILQAENQDLKHSIELISEEYHNLGLYLKAHPFIPEYLGFTETLLEKNNLLQARIYTLQGFNITRPIDTRIKHWLVMSPDGEINKVFLKNMYEAIIVLAACGMNVSIQDYFKENSLQMKP